MHDLCHEGKDHKLGGVLVLETLVKLDEVSEEILSQLARHQTSDSVVILTKLFQVVEVAEGQLQHLLQASAITVAHCSHHLRQVVVDGPLCTSLDF